MAKFAPASAVTSNMHGMNGSRRTRRAVALLTAVLLFVCQTAVAAAACAGGIAAAASKPQTTPCHQGVDVADISIDETTPQVPAVPSACDAAKVLSQQIELPSIPLADLPSLALPSSQLPWHEVASIAPDSAANPCSSPPLTVLHCRFLN